MLDVAPWYFQKPNHCQGHSCPFAALHKAWSSYFHKKLGVFSASPFSKAPNLPMVSCFCTLLYAVQTIPKEPKETIIKHLMEKLEMLMLHAWRLENIDTCCDFLVLNTLVFFPTFSVTQYNWYFQLSSCGGVSRSPQGISSSCSAKTKSFQGQACCKTEPWCIPYCFQVLCHFWLSVHFWRQNVTPTLGVRISLFNWQYIVFWHRMNVFLEFPVQVSYVSLQHLAAADST